MSGLSLAGLPDDAGESAQAPPKPILVPDAGMGVKWFVPEPDAEAAARLLDNRFELHVPSYFFTEAASVFQRKVAVERTLSEAEALDIFRLLRAVPLTVHATEDLLEQAMRHSIRYRRPVYDSLYMVLVMALGGQVVTADHRLYNGVRGGPLEHLVLWITDPL